MYFTFFRLSAGLPHTPVLNNFTLGLSKFGFKGKKKKSWEGREAQKVTHTGSLYL